MTQRVDQQGWREVPQPPVRETSSAPSIVALVLLLAGPVLRTHRESVEVDRVLAVAGILLVLHLLHALLPSRAWYLRLVATAAAGAACVPFGGIGVGAWAVLAATALDWSWRSRPPFPGLPRGEAASRLPAAVALGVAAGWGLWSGSRIVPLVLCAVALATTLVTSVAPSRVARVSERISGGVGAVLGWVVFGLLGLVVVVVPWLGQRMVGHDPLAPGTGASSGWIPRARRSVRSESPWAVDPRLDEPPASLRWRRRLVAPALCVVAAAAVLAWGELDPLGSDDPSRDVVVPVALADQPQGAEHVEDLDWFFAVAFDPTSTPRIKDVRSRTVNVRDGRRLSWVPPECDCPRVSLWFFGGSTAFGMGQRDEHTIASEIARVAWEDGVAVDVDNYGVPADMLLHEAQTFAWELEHRPAPDLAVFFDGINDMAGALHRQDAGCATRTGPPIDPALDRLRQRVLHEIHTDRWDPQDGPAGARVLPSCDGERVSTEALAELAVDHYSRALHISRTTAAAHEVEAFWFWQPSIYTRERRIEGEPVDDEDGGAWSRQWWQAARDRLPEEVVDVADALDALDEPVFFDTMHHNERAARVIAEELYRTLRPAILRAAEGAP